eukprot:COSAG06_NODE_905_length_11625_cov_24.210394_5_plen_41_part_00
MITDGDERLLPSCRFHRVPVVAKQVLARVTHTLNLVTFFM